ncbi:phospholipase C/P1 nuclease [Violaceomyces palustris]|uniref:Phospholipase C/P1 nuclease n=1 Tax=Violaceomyces palustris TaxID=1673888 RepID=A0ACD0P096_9BASI|nr:phospholipase C/P1 nuclease [Violaceomyces palustris]
MTPPFIRDRHLALSNVLIPFSIGLFLLAQRIQAWGIVGHQIVATIAQTQLHPLVRQHLCTILPAFTSYPSDWPTGRQQHHHDHLEQQGSHTHCHLATLAGWPDNVRYRLPWSSQLHYVNPMEDHPPDSCLYGEKGWTNQDNLLTSMVNYTSRLVAEHGYQRDQALRFVVHFFGDAHQPLHLTGRAKGGNDIWVHFEGRKVKLHSVWDTLLINKQIRQLSNYTSPLPSARIESALRGAIYDNYVRWILNEGLGQPGRLASGDGQKISGWWSDELDSWTVCEGRVDRADLPDAQLVMMASKDGAGDEKTFDPSKVDDTDLPLCPYQWTKAIHPLVCEYAFAKPVPETDPEDDRGAGASDPGEPAPIPSPAPLPELDVPEYVGRIEGDKVIQRQLAEGGVRLAALLNTLLLEEAEKAQEEAQARGLRSPVPLSSRIWSLLHRGAMLRFSNLFFL